MMLVRRSKGLGVPQLGFDLLFGRKPFVDEDYYVDHLTLKRTFPAITLRCHLPPPPYESVSH